MIELWADTYICPKPYCDTTPAAIINGKPYTQDMIVAETEKYAKESARQEKPGASEETMKGGG